MSRAELLYLMPYLVCLLLLAGIFVLALRNRYLRGARAFAWLTAGQVLGTIGAILELVSPSLELKIFWDTIQWLAAAFLITLPFLVFSVEFTEQKPGSAFWGIILTFLGIFATILLTDEIHHLVYRNPRLTSEGAFQALTYDFTFVTYIYLLFYFYAMNLYGIVLFVRRALQPDSIFRLQYIIVAAAFLFPLAASLLPLVDIRLSPDYDVTPLASAVGSVVAAWGLFRYGLFDISFTAREQVMERLPDPIIVVDARNRVADLNEAALTFLKKPRAAIIGHALHAALEKWKPLAAVLNDPLMRRTEIVINRDGENRYFDIRVSEILGLKREGIGRIFIMRDLTRLKKVEAEYRNLRRDVEQRIQDRTETLQSMADRYRTIVENQTDLIVRWKPDGTRTFVNEPYCRFWELTGEQALARNFLFHPAEEDRPAVEKNVVRLNSGISEVETETHRVVLPDGSTAWLEWTDNAVRDEWGNLTEIQSIGRDVTDRMPAEDKLA